MSQEKVKHFYGRESFMEALKKKLLDSQSAHYLLTGKWGSGKTTIIHKLMNDINENNEGTKAILIDAWENDAFEDPNLVLMHRLFEEKLLNEDMVKAETKNKDDKLSFLPIKQVLKAFTKNNYEIDIDEVFSGFETNESRFYLDQISKMQEEKFYKKMLEDMIEIAMKEQCNQLIFCIDELDRARPDFTVRLLERYHHLRVQGLNVIFVYVSDYEALVDNIESYYGFKNRGAEYIEKMFDSNFVIPDLTIEEYRNYYKNHKQKSKISYQYYNFQRIDIRWQFYEYLQNRKVSFRTMNQILLFFQDDFLWKVIDFGDRISLNDINRYLENFNQIRIFATFTIQNIALLQILDSRFALNMIENWHRSKQYRRDLILTIKDQMLKMDSLEYLNLDESVIREQGKKILKDLGFSEDIIELLIYVVIQDLFSNENYKVRKYIY